MTKTPELIHAQIKARAAMIQNLCLAPHWTPDRKHEIKTHADAIARLLKEMASVNASS